MRAALGAAVAGVLAGVDTDADLTLTAGGAELILALADVAKLGRTGLTLAGVTSSSLILATLQ